MSFTLLTVCLSPLRSTLLAIILAIPASAAPIFQRDLQGQAVRILLYGMTTTGKPRAWSNPHDESKHYWIGDNLGQIRLTYADGTEQIYPLILGESIWWGDLFRDYPNPFPTDAVLRHALADALRLSPAAPVADGRYLAVIEPKSAPLRRLSLEANPAKQGNPVIDQIELQRESVPLATQPRLSGQPVPLLPAGSDRTEADRHLDELRTALYSSELNYQGHVPAVTPAGYRGPTVTFKGAISAEILTNVFSANLADIAAKIEPDGTFHTSTKGATSWGSYNGFGTFRPNDGKYFHQAFARDLGRELQELTELGYLDEARRCAAFCFRVSRIWGDEPHHWGQVINRAGKGGSYENDGHGLISVYIYKLWQRLPDRDVWLRQNWTDVKAAGDWIDWQFTHPELSGATDVLRTTGEAAGGPRSSGNSIYADAVCRNALLGFAVMADSIGDHGTANRWRARAAKMTEGMTHHYLVKDPAYGSVWTEVQAGWCYQSTPLGPLILNADTQGFVPEDSLSLWREASLHAYHRVTAHYQPFGFYGAAMGYGQGFVTESALLLDQMRDATKMVDWTAREIWDPRFGTFITPEGCEIDPTGTYWYRIGDLGNGVQEGEIQKVLRLIIGVDDADSAHPRLCPRLPLNWTEIRIDHYPMLVAGTLARVSYHLKRSAVGMTFEVSADRDIGKIPIRLGPVSLSELGDRPAELSGDSQWVRFDLPVGTIPQSVALSERDMNDTR